MDHNRTASNNATLRSIAFVHNQQPNFKTFQRIRDYVHNFDHNHKQIVIIFLKL